MPFERNAVDDAWPGGSRVVAAAFEGAYRPLDYFTICGVRGNVGGSFSDVWERSVDMVYPSIATAVNVVSSSASDASAGTGAQVVRVVGWNDSWQLAQEDVVLNGTSAVTGVKKFWRIISTRVVRAGSGGRNAGQVDVKIDTQFASIMAINDNRSLGSHFTVPPGKTGIILNLFATGAIGGGQIDWGGARLYMRMDAGGPLFAMHEVMLGGGGPSASPVPRLLVPGPADISMRALASGAGSNKRVAAGYDVILRDEPYPSSKVIPF